MKPIIPIAIAGVVLYGMSSKKKTKVSTIKPKIEPKTEPKTETPFNSYISDDCEWVCQTSESELDLMKGILIHDEIMANAIKKLQDKADIVSVAQETFNTYLSQTKCKPKNSEITPLDSLTIRYVWINHLISSALYLAYKGVYDENYIFNWLYFELPKTLIFLQLMLIGDSKVNTIAPRFEVEDSVIYNSLKDIFLIIPKLKLLGAKLLTALIIIKTSQIIEIEKKEKCVKITDLYYADYTTLSGKTNKLFESQFTRIFGIVVKAL